ncbi:MAG: trigger factor [Candidatus Pacebacteria bacterium]|nr:trigger factor [Candidatus Paceibacterota bacterium]
MSLEIKKLPKSEVEITGEVEAGEFLKFYKKAVEDLAKEIKVDGFRPGKAPEQIIVEKLGEGAVLEEAAELALSDVYPKIISDKKIEAIGRPKATITKIAKGDSLGFKFVVSVLPEMKLPDNFKEIALEKLKVKEEAKVSEKELEEAVDYLRKARKKEGSGELPELDDEFARSVGKFENLEHLKKTVSENLQIEKEMNLKEKKRLEALEEILKKSEFEIPDILIDAEKLKMLQELKSSIVNMGLKWEDYLQHVNKKEEEIVAGWAEESLRRVRYGLLLRHLGEILPIEILHEEVHKKADEFGAPHSDEHGIDRKRFEDYAYGIIRNEKIFLALGEPSSADKKGSPGEQN